MSNQASVHSFNTIGYITAKLSDEQLVPIWDEIKKIQSNFNTALPYNDQLAGNLEHEYSLIDCIESTHKIVMPYINAMDDVFHHIKDYQILDRHCEYMMQSLWVNFQKKYEFNPMHNHSGVYSFVIWMKVPYKIADEIASKSSQSARMKCPAHFQFTYTDSLGQIAQELIPVDSTYENVICIFPAKLNHQVYPFYTSDDYRISVAGNIGLRVGE